MTETALRTYKVPAENLEKLQEQVANLNKKVARLKKRGYDAVQPVVIQVGELYTEEQSPHVNEITGVVTKRPDRVYADVTLLSPEPPKVDGWEFVAALTHVEGVGAVLRVVPGAQVAEGELKKYREASPDNCDHCHAKRRRTDTFIIRKVS